MSRRRLAFFLIAAGFFLSGFFLMVQYQRARRSLLAFAGTHGGLDVKFGTIGCKVVITSQDALVTALERIEAVGDCDDLYLGAVELDLKAMKAFEALPIKKLTIFQCKMPPSARAAVREFVYLTDLDIGVRRVPNTSQNGLLASKNAIPSDLDLVETEWRDEDLAKLSSLRNLRSFKATNHLGLTGVGFRTWASDIPLIELDLYGSRITDRGLNEISKFKNVTRIALQDSAVTADGLLVLAEMPALVVPHHREDWTDLEKVEFGLRYNEQYAIFHPTSNFVPCNFYQAFKQNELIELLDGSKVFRGVDNVTGVGIKRNAFITERADKRGPPAM